MRTTAKLISTATVTAGLCWYLSGSPVVAWLALVAVVGFDLGRMAAWR